MDATAWLQLAAGLTLLLAGGELLVRGASGLARRAGISPLVIGLTVVAYGTSAPEMVVSVNASLAGHPDVAVGDVVGSNIFNILAILGVSALIAGPSGLAVAPSMEHFDIPVMTAVAVACLPLMARAHRLARWEGALFLAYYVAYTAYLPLAAREHGTLPRFSAVMLEFVVPPTAATIFAVWLAQRRGPADPKGV